MGAKYIRADTYEKRTPNSVQKLRNKFERGRDVGEIFE